MAEVAKAGMQSRKVFIKNSEFPNSILFLCAIFVKPMTPVDIENMAQNAFSFVLKNNKKIIKDKFPKYTKSSIYIKLFLTQKRIKRNVRRYAYAHRSVNTKIFKPLPKK